VTFKELLCEMGALLREWWGWKRRHRHQRRQRRQQPWELPLERLSRRIDELESLRTQISRLEGEQTFVRKLVSDKILIDREWLTDLVAGQTPEQTRRGECATQL